FLIPFLLVFLLDRMKGIKQTWPALLVVSGAYTAVQTLTMAVLGPELANILAALFSMGGLALFLRKWQPKEIYREEGAGETGAKKA
ncbi:L-lactate permease, partial [Pseudomonas sp. GW456-E7]